MAGFSESVDLGVNALDGGSQRKERACIFSYQRDLPMILAIRNAVFISYGQLYSQLRSQGSEKNRQGFSWRLSRLGDLGLVRKMKQIVPFNGPTYTITREGLSCLESCSEGLLSLTSESRVLPSEAQAAHFLELGEIRGALRRAGIMEKWIGDVELKSLNLVLETPLAKDYDAIADLTIGPKGQLTVAIEFERSVKKAARYCEIVERIKEETQIDMLLYLTASADTVYQLTAILMEIDFAIALGASKQFCSDPMKMRLHNTVDEDRKMTLSELSERLGSHARKHSADVRRFGSTV
jgi:DNA-binding transcriptional ArsR family regulator